VPAAHHHHHHQQQQQQDLMRFTLPAVQFVHTECLCCLTAGAAT
jgi:hypothetical protein